MIWKMSQKVRDFIEMTKKITLKTTKDKELMYTKIEYVGEIPTKNGLHILVKPFNPSIFTQRITTVSIHKDSPTVLYCC